MELLISSPPQVETLEKSRVEWMRYCAILEVGIELLRVRRERCEREMINPTPPEEISSAG